VAETDELESVFEPDFEPDFFIIMAAVLS